MPQQHQLEYLQEKLKQLKGEGAKAEAGQSNDGLDFQIRTIAQELDILESKARERNTTSLDPLAKRYADAEMEFLERAQSATSARERSQLLDSAITLRKLRQQERQSHNTWLARQLTEIRTTVVGLGMIVAGGFLFHSHPDLGTALVSGGVAVITYRSFRPGGNREIEDVSNDEQENK